MLATILAVLSSTLFTLGCIRGVHISDIRVTQFSNKHGTCHIDQVYVLERLICSISFDFEHHVNSIIPLKSK